MTYLTVHGAREGNLKNLSVEIPRNKLIVFTGVSGSGKSTLANDVIFQECQRQYLEAIGYQGFRKPKVDSIRNVSPAIRITQTESNKNPRSTLGTLTYLYADLRMVYEKLGVRLCPQCKAEISAADCKEETDKVNGEFHVYMICNHCGFKMDKLTRTHYSYNTREGACRTCQGLGKVMTVRKDKCVDESLSLEAGAVDYWVQNYKEYQIETLYRSFRHYQIAFKPHTPVAEYSDIQKAILYHGVESEEVKKAFPQLSPPKTAGAGKFEGVLTTLWRRLSDKGGEAKHAQGYFDSEVCPDCKGERLGDLSRVVTVEGTRLPELGFLTLEELKTWVFRLERSLSEANRSQVEVYLLDLKTKLQRIVNVGLSYLSLDRQIITLSGGELQRVKLAAALDSTLTGVIYIMDEPTAGLHPKDTEGMVQVLKRLRDLGNTVIVIEHDPDVMQAADHIIDIGPGSGKHGGQMIGQGTIEELKAQETSVTGAYLKRKRVQPASTRSGTGEFIEIQRANANNLKNIHVKLPLGCLVAVSGVSGSGKSTLVFDVLAQSGPKGSNGCNLVSGTDHFDQIITIEQTALTRMKRSNVATYSDAYTEIRKIFGGLNEARARGLSAKDFSFNTKGGRCENCEGLGYVTSNLLFFENQEVVCPVCGGNQFNGEVLALKYKGFSIKDVLNMSVDEALPAFHEHAKLARVLTLLKDVGLGYLELGQTLTTLSGGEGQRLKLAVELLKNKGKTSLYLMDEPTAGLHPVDVERFLVLLNRMVDSGNTVIVVEHNQQLIQASDWIIDMGPEGGINGGEVVFAGTLADLLKCGRSATAEYLRIDVAYGGA
jgi:excinuclease ABC subunit A